MDVESALRLCDGAATWTELQALGVAPRELSAAVSAGSVHRPHRGTYVWPDTFAPLSAAKRLRGHVSHASAARFRGFEMINEPTESHVTVARSRRTKPIPGVVVHRADVPPTERSDKPFPVTDDLRTVLDCARTMTLRESVAIADSALRTGRLSEEEVVVAAARLRGNGSAAARQAAALIDPLAESVLESAARVEMYLAGLPRPVSQFPVMTSAGPRRLDFYFEEAQVGVETDGFATHGLRAGLVGDCVRHNAFVLAGLLVVRFAWEHVIGMPEFFIATVQAALEIGRARKAPQCPRCGRLRLPAAA